MKPMRAGNFLFLRQTRSGSQKRVRMIRVLVRSRVSSARTVGRRPIRTMRLETRSKKRAQTERRRNGNIFGVIQHAPLAPCTELSLRRRVNRRRSHITISCGARFASRRLAFQMCLSTSTQSMMGLGASPACHARTNRERHPRGRDRSTMFTVVSFKRQRPMLRSAGRAQL